MASSLPRSIVEIGAKKIKREGNTEDRTRVTGIRTLGDNHYTISPYRDNSIFSMESTDFLVYRYLYFLKPLLRLKHADYKGYI